MGGQNHPEDKKPKTEDVEVVGMDWREIFTGDFVVNMLSVITALVIYDKFIKKRV